MKEWIVDLHPKGSGFNTQTRVFAANQAAALVSAHRLYPNYNIGSVKTANP